MNKSLYTRAQKFLQRYHGNAILGYEIVMPMLGLDENGLLSLYEKNLITPDVSMEGAKVGALRRFVKRSLDEIAKKPILSQRIKTAHSETKTYSIQDPIYAFGQNLMTLKEEVGEPEIAQVAVHFTQLFGYDTALNYLSQPGIIDIYRNKNGGSENYLRKVARVAKTIERNLRLRSNLSIKKRPELFLPGAFESLEKSILTTSFSL